MSDKKDNAKKKHADFQDTYRKSSNFQKLTDKESDKLKITGDGDLKVKNINSEEE